MRFEPDMHPRLVAHLDGAFQRLVKRGGDPADHQILRFVGNIRGIEIAEIVIPDAVIGGTAGQAVQHTLIYRARHRQRVRQIERPHRRQHPHQRRRGVDDPLQPPD